MRRSRWQDADDDGGCLKVMQGKGARANGFVPTTPSAAAPQLVQIVHARMLERLGCLRHPLNAWLWLGQTQTLSSALQHSLSHACGQKPGLVVDYAGNAAVKTPVASATAPADPPQRKTRWSAWLPSLKPRPERTSDAATLPNLAWVCMDPHFASAPRAGLAWLTQVVAPGGFLFFAAPGPGSLWALQDLYSAAGWGPAVPAWPDMPQWGQHLLQAGYLDPVLDVEHIALSYAPSTSSPGATPATPANPVSQAGPATPARQQPTHVDCMLQDLRQLGKNTAAHRYPGLRTPAWLERLRHALATVDSLEFEIIYGHARLPEGQSADVHDATVKMAYFSLDALRQTLSKNNY